MFPDGFEPLNFEDTILVARINLCCAAVAVMLFAFLGSWDWPGQTVAPVAAASFIYLARQLDRVFRRFDSP